MQSIKTLIMGANAGVGLVNIFDLSAISSSGPSSVAYALNSGGSGQTNGDHPIGWTWLLRGVAADYQVRATLLSGDAPSGTALNSWLSLSTSRTWSLTAVNEGVVYTCDLQISIRRATTGTMLDTAQITLTAKIQVIP